MNVRQLKAGLRLVGSLSQLGRSVTKALVVSVTLVGVPCCYPCVVCVDLLKYIILVMSGILYNAHVMFGTILNRDILVLSIIWMVVLSEVQLLSVMTIYTFDVIGCHGVSCYFVIYRSIQHWSKFVCY